MFSKPLCATLLAFSLSAFTAQAAPHNRFGFGNGNNQESCNTVSVVTRTVTVTAAAAGPTSNNSGNGGAAGNNGQQNNAQQNNGNNGQQNNNNGQQNNGNNGQNNNGQQNNGNNGQQNNNNGQQNNGNNGQQNNGQNNNGNNGQNNNNGQQNNSGNNGNNGQQNNGGNNGQNNGQQNNGGNNGQNGGDAQTSLTLDPAVIASGFANNGQSVPAAGQVASLTSTNNFINFCLTAPNTPITNGKQITAGSCNPAPIGLIPSIDNMPSSKFVFPQNFGNVGANQAFTIRMAIKNMITGNFVNAQENYFAAPQQLNNGQIVGHSHVVVEQLASIDQNQPTDPKKFAFFKGLNAAAQNGELTADVSNGLPEGAYRLCSINTAANHQPAIVPVAQHGALDDCVYFTAGNAGNNGGNNNGNNGGNNNGNNGNNGNNSQNNGGNNAGNLQPFTEAIGGFAAPAVTAGGRGFQVQGSDDFVNIGAALGRSCDIQKNQCADAANSGAGHTVQQCEEQRARCGQAIQNVNAGGTNFLSSLPPVESSTASASSVAESASVTSSASSVVESASVTASASTFASESAAPTESESASVETSATESASSEVATATSKVADVTSSAAVEATSSAAAEEATLTSEAASAETSAPTEEKGKGKKGKGQQEESQN